MSLVGGADVVGTAEGNTCPVVMPDWRASRRRRPLHVRKHLLGTGRSPAFPRRLALGDATGSRWAHAVDAQTGEVVQGRSTCEADEQRRGTYSGVGGGKGLGQGERWSHGCTPDTVPGSCVRLWLAATDRTQTECRRHGAPTGWSFVPEAGTGCGNAARPGLCGGWAAMPVPTAFAPRANSFAERWVGTVRREALDHLLIFGRRHLTHVMAEFVGHYNEARPHQSLRQRAPCHLKPTLVPVDGRVIRRDRLGGLLHEYCRAAA